MAVLPHPPRLPVEPGDKVQHVAAFLTLGLLSAWAYPRTPLLQLLIRLSLFGALIELVQAIPSLGRDSDPLDWLAGTGAAALVLLALRWGRRAWGWVGARGARARPRRRGRWGGAE